MSSAVQSVLRGRCWAVVLGAVVCAAVVAGEVSPSWAADERGGSESPVVGEFTLGAAVLGQVDERSGAFTVMAPLGGLTLAWDSRSTVADRFMLGHGWAMSGVGFVDTEGGVRVFPARSQAGVFAADASVPSGLAGYDADDVRFSQHQGVLPARAGQR